MLNSIVKFSRAMSISALLLVSASSVYAVEYKLPEAGELQGFSQPALQFYTSGVAALDRVDYRNAYNFLAKAAQLEPGAIRLNQLTAGLALNFGRRVKAEEAKNFYQTAIASYENVLQNPAVEPELRRDMINRLKIARDEMNNLAQRDVIREASGQAFVKDENKKYGGTPTPGAGSTTPADAALTPAVSTAATPDAQGLYPGQVVLTPAVPTGPGGQPLPGAPPDGMIDPALSDNDPRLL